MTMRIRMIGYLVAIALAAGMATAPSATAETATTDTRAEEACKKDTDKAYPDPSLLDGFLPFVDAWRSVEPTSSRTQTSAATT
jgi:hypothetical protein